MIQNVIKIFLIVYYYKMATNRVEYLVNGMVDEKGMLTEQGKKNIRIQYNKLTKLGLTVTSSRVIFNDNDKRIVVNPGVKLTDKNGNYITHTSKILNENDNMLYVHTGSQYGNIIAIDVDINKGKVLDERKQKGVEIFESILKEFDQTIFYDNDALTVDKYKSTTICTTPSGGRHYLFKLNKNQANKLRLLNLKQGQLGLFGLDIDVLYETGRCWMAGFVRKLKGVCDYRLIGKVAPSPLPDFIFSEICCRIKALSKPLANIQRIQPNINKLETKIEKNRDGLLNDTDLETKIDVIENFLECLHPNRCSNRDDWLRIGAIIFNEGCPFEVFDRWSKTCPDKYDEEGVKKTWNGYKDNRATKARIGTLIKLAKEDNYENAYCNPKLVGTLVDTKIGISKVVYKKFKKLLLQTNDVSIAKFFKAIYPNDYIYDTTQRVWYVANEYGIYEQDTEELLSARVRLSNNVRNIFNKCGSFYCNKLFAGKEDTEEQQSHRKKVIANINKISNKFRIMSTKKTIIDSLKELYMVSKFITKKNPKDYLFAFSNGVYDLSTFTFRNAERDELVCGCVGYEYSESTQEDRELVIHTIKSMFLSDELYEYFMTIISHRLIKRILHEEIYFMIGDASNGKGLVTTLIQNTFGEYTQFLEPNTFVKTKNITNANVATPALASTHDSHIVFVNELDRDMTISSETLKRLSGTDKVKVRFLHKECFNFIPTYNLFFVSNYSPEIDGDDKGIQRRLRYIPFNVTFKDDPQGPTEKKINRDLKKLFSNTKYSCAFIDILIEFYKKYVDGGKVLNVPKEVLVKSAEYLEENDPVKQFVDKCLEITNKDEDVITSSLMMKEFKEYSNNIKGYTFAKLKQRLTKDFKINFKETRKGSNYCGVKIVTEQEDHDVIDFD